MEEINMKLFITINMVLLALLVGNNSLAQIEIEDSLKYQKFI